MKLISALIVSCFMLCSNANASGCGRRSMNFLFGGSYCGYVSASLQSNAHFSDSYGSYSSAGGSLDLMFHSRGFLWDNGFGYSNFGSLASSGSQNFLLNNLHVQTELTLFGPVYFRGGYGLSFLKTSHQSAMTVGGIWKWGFGLKLPLGNGICANAEATRFDGPGPIGFWSPSLGMEYHF